MLQLQYRSLELLIFNQKPFEFAKFYIYYSLTFMQIC